MIDAIYKAIIQILVFTSIPFLVYLIQKKSVKGFFDYIGLKKSTKRANSFAIIACLIFAAPLMVLTLASDDFKEMMFSPNSLAGKFREMGLSINSIAILLVTAIFKTSFAEEILFRGFVAKRLISTLGFVKGNLLQASIFGIIHTILFALITKNPIFLTVIFLIPSIGAYISVILNEKLGNGSIVPGWISHGLANVLSYSFVGFVI
jgi:membrane protease YdiL (CAAX protease family)